MKTKDPKEEWRYPNLPPKPFLYESGPSLLDEGDARSALNKSPIKGFFNLTVIFMSIFFITQPVVNFIDHGYFFEPTLYNTFKVDFMFCIFTWPLFFAWSFTSFFIQKLIMKGLPHKIALILQHLTQLGLFVYSLVVIFQHDWCSTHAAFVILQACAHFMKMHSYITVNRDLRQQYEDAVKANRPAKSNYPNNVTLKDFVLFMWTPWLVYADYPRRKTINYTYAFKKAFNTIMVLMVMYMVHTSFMQPWIQIGSSITMIQLNLRLMLPSTAFLILGFYLVFENMCNFFAQITRLDHRQFYEDWWNSYTYEEFNRKWNKPVHIFLYRHVYLELIVRHKKSKRVAQAFTFLFSACLHEFLLAVIFRIVRPIFLVFILIQIPLIYLTKWMKNSRSGQYLFWYGLVHGPSLIVCSYLRIDEKVTMMFSRQ